jgi:pyruvate,orthophosphate dikinase
MLSQKKYVYLFSEGNAEMRNLLGGKGANLAEMTNIGIPVPQGFTITTEACTKYYDDGEENQLNEVIDQRYLNMSKLEKMTGKKFGDVEKPLLVSVRSGARASMPGMMDTILNLGLNDKTVEGLVAKLTNNERFAFDSVTEDLYRCSQMLLWKLKRENLKKYLMKLKQKQREQNLIQI